MYVWHMEYATLEKVRKAMRASTKIALMLEEIGMVDAPPGVPEPTEPPMNPPDQWTGGITDKKTPDDPVNPKHYVSDAGQQLIDVIEQFGLAESFHLASAITYIFRAGRKPKVRAHEDIEKAIWYLIRHNKYHSNSTQEVSDCQKGVDNA